MKNPTSADQKIYDLLWKDLSSAYCLTAEDKAWGDAPECKTLAGTELYYDEGNEEIRTREGLFWSEIDDNQARKILADFILKEAPLQKEYHLCEPEWRDDFPMDILEKCLEEKSFQPAIEEDWYTDEKVRCAVAATREILKAMGFSDEEADDFQTYYGETFDELRFAVEERDASFPEKELLLRSNAHGFLYLQSNYDCWIDICEAGGLWYDGAMQGLLAVLSLNPRKVKEEALRQGVTVNGRWPDYPGRDGKEVVNYDAFVKSLRETPNYGNWAFLGTFDMQGLWDEKFNTDKMIIPSDTTCGMFNSWKGGGTLFFARTIHPLPVKDIIRIQKRYSDGFSVHVDEGGRPDYGYPPSSVYGTHPSDDQFLS